MQRFVNVRLELSCLHCNSFTHCCQLINIGRCSLPLGLEDKRITNGHLSASTYYNHHLAPWHGRLNHRWSWSARTNNHNQWFQVSFVSVVKATGIATQGRQDASQWVMRYIVSYSPDSTNFRYYREGRGTKVRGHFSTSSPRFFWELST